MERDQKNTIHSRIVTGTVGEAKQIFFLGKEIAQRAQGSSQAQTVFMKGNPLTLPLKRLPSRMGSLGNTTAVPLKARHSTPI